MRAVDASLASLGVDYLELYAIHWPVPARGLYVETWRALEKVKSNGPARSIGVSNFPPDVLEQLLTETDTVPAVNQVELHPWLPAKARLRRLALSIQPARLVPQVALFGEACGAPGRYSVVRSGCSVFACLLLQVGADGVEAVVAGDPGIAGQCFQQFQSGPGAASHRDRDGVIKDLSVTG